KFNEAIALLAGDALLTFGFQLLSDAGNIEIAREVSRAVGSQGTIGGQVVDITKTQTGELRTNRDLDYIAKNKTGALFGAACEAGAIFSNAGKKKIQALGDFGKNFGITFQLVDDLIDKDGYIKVYGADHVEKMAGLLNKRAKDSLKIFGAKGAMLSEIAELILHRKS
ncbi:MAG: polyprenyl synthetase family protein, partial [Candidatus Omnitrophica bacterium]|nr:polyprenyl synthetase family protein [Candidatus Omnitrophota bacterium]